MAELAGLLAASFLAATLFPLPEKAKHWLRRFGAPATFFAWLPILGDGLSLAAGWLRIHWLAVLVFMAAGRLLRYITVAVVSFSA